MIKEHDQLINRIKHLKEYCNKEKILNSEKKLNLEMAQIKQKELEESIKSSVNRNLETEINLEKLMEQLK